MRQLWVKFFRGPVFFELTNRMLSNKNVLDGGRAVFQRPQCSEADAPLVPTGKSHEGKVGENFRFLEKCGRMA
jgi:hypothetical protein